MNVAADKIPLNILYDFLEVDYEKARTCDVFCADGVCGMRAGHC